MFREFLIASGVAPKDIADAVSEARGFVRSVARWSDVAAQGAQQVVTRTKSKKIRTGALLALGAAGFVNAKASALLGGKGK